MKRWILLGLLFLSVLLSSAACDEFLFSKGSILNSSVSSREIEDMTKLIEAFIAEMNPAIEFADVTNDPSVALPGERVGSPEQPPEPRIVPPKQEPGDYRAISNETVQTSIPETLSAQNPADIFNRWRKYRKFKIVPFEDLQRTDQLLFEAERYHFSLNPDLVQLEKTKRICSILEDEWKKINNYEKLSNVLGKLKIELIVPGRGTGGIGSIEISETDLDLLDDMVASFIIAHLIPGEIKVFVRGYADSCSQDVDCKLHPLTQYPYYYDKVKIHHFINPNRDNPEVQEFQEVATDEPTGIGDGYYMNRDLPHLRARFLVEEFLQTWLGRCEYPKINREEIGVLQGRILTQSDSRYPQINPEYRKAEIYFLVRR